MENISIAIDGPAGAGKSTVSKLISKNLNIEYVDTGAMYRALTLKIINENINMEDIQKVLQVLKRTTIDFIEGHIFLDGKTVDNEIRTKEVSVNVSNVAKIKEVREILVNLQREIAKNKSIVMDGRDIGTHVLPNADFKFFITASLEERSKRRYIELIDKGNITTLESVTRDIERRDKIDSTREIAPLVKSQDAIEIDTTGKSIAEIVTKILEHIKKGGN